MDMDVVRKWAAQNYPFLVGNDDVIVMLYKKQVLGEDVVPKTKAAGVYRESNNVVQKENAVMLATVVDVDNTYIKEICSVCKKRVCEHNAPKTNLYCAFGTAVDRAGKVGFKLFTTDEKNFQLVKESNTLLVTGYLDANENFGEDKFNIRNLRIVSPLEAVAFLKAVDFIQMKGIQGKVKKAEWDNFLSAITPDSAKEIIKSYLVLKEEGDEIFTVVQ